MTKRTQRVLSMVMAVFFLLGSAVSAVAYHEDDETIHEFADPRFEARWAYTDLPVSELVVARTWIWGPSPFTEGRMEPYLDSPGGERLVQYFDKSRMELNDPNGDPDDLWSVTQGLLALDMMTGQVQVGDRAFAAHSEGASMENVAGDPGADNGPTYATMGTLIQEEAREEGTTINERLSLDGEITVDESLDDMNVTAAERVTQDWVDHTVASVFWDFMNSETTVWDGEDYVEAPLFENPFYATGLPTTEAYWANVRVKGEEREVLLQCFERRCLTYTPGNPEGWEVEAGNVGQHYYRWLETHVGPLVPLTILSDNLVQPRGITYTDEGIYVAEAGVGGDECVTIQEEFEGEVEEFEICVGLTGAVTLVDDDGQERVVENLPSLAFEAEGSGPHDVTFDDEGNMYIIIGMGGPPEARDGFGETGELLATVVRVEDDGELTLIADLAEYEAENNPDGGLLDTNPYSIAFDGEDLIATDAGGNSLLRINLDEDNDIETIATFESRDVEAPPFLGMEPGATIPMESVPTGVAIGPDGNYYVAELTGFPFEPGSARIHQVMPNGDTDVFAEGFTNLGDVAFDSEGNLYALEIVAGGLLNVDQEAAMMGDLSTAASRIVKIDDEGEQTELNIPGIYFGTGIALGDDDEIYVVHKSIIPGAELVRVEEPRTIDDGDGVEARVFSTSLSGDEEVPPVDTDASGDARFVLSEDGASIDYEVNVENIDNVTMAHIHLAPAGENGDVVVWLYPSGPPPQEIPGTSSGLLAEGTFTADDLVGPLEGESLDTLIDAMESGETYVNVHTTQNPGGEIRGQIEMEHAH